MLYGEDKKFDPTEVHPALLHQVDQPSRCGYNYMHREIQHQCLGRECSPTGASLAASTISS